MYCECMYLASLSQKELAQFGEISRHRVGSPRGLVLVRAPRPRGSGSACESDGDDSDGQGAPQGGGGVQSTPVSARVAEILRGLRGLEASFMRK